MTPLELEFLLHCNSSSEVHHKFDSDAIQSTILMFKHEKLIVERSGAVNETRYRCTDRGRAFVYMLTHIPLPVEQPEWFDDHGRVIPRTG